MDNLRNLDANMSGMPDYESFEDDLEPAIEPPALIGQDERRMHVRAYNFWASLLGERTYPDIEDLEPADNDDFGANSVLLDFTQGIENPGITFLGSKLRHECGIDEQINSIADVPARSLLSRITDHYLQIIANEAPIGFEAEFVNQRGANIMYRGILLPFSTNDEGIDFIYGVINWKECASPAEQAALSAEVDTALQSASPAADGNSVWADGPTATPLTDRVSSEDRDEFIADDILDLADMQPADAASLGDWLQAARSSVEFALDCEKRSRAALYTAIGHAYDFYLMTLEHQLDYNEILMESGITVQERAPMTPIVKLVFGKNYDKTRLTEFAAALRFADSLGLERGTFADYLQSYKGGLKALVQAERAERNGEELTEVRELTEDPRPRLRMAPARRLDELETGDAEFVVLVARRNSQGELEIVGPVDGGKQMTDKALRHVAI